MTEQQQAAGERGVRTAPRPAPLDGRSFSRTIECDESAPETKRTAVAGRGRARRDPEETGRSMRGE